MPLPNNKKEFQSFLGLINYLRKLSSSNTGGVQGTDKTHIMENGLTWNNTYQNLYDRAKTLS